MLFFKTTYHESRGVLRLAPKQHWSYFWVFWGKIQLSSAQHVSWFGFGRKKFPGNSLPHMGLSSMPFWSKYKDPPTFMKCGINFLKMLIIVITYNICSFFIYLHYFFKGIYLRNILSYNKYTFGLINFWFDAVRSTFRGDPIFSLQKHSSHLARLYFGLFLCVLEWVLSPKGY